MVCATTHRMFLNVGYDLTEKQIRCFFDSFGPVTDVYLPRQANGRNKGFGFATFGDAEALQAALKLSAHTIDGFTVQVKRAGPRPSEPDACTRSSAPLLEVKPQPIGRGSRRLYVGEVSDTIPAAKIKRHFGAWGKVADVLVCGKDASKHTKNYFVTFENASSAEKAHDQSPRCFEGWPVTSISLAEGSKPEPVQDMKKQAEISASASEQALASTLQAQIAAAGCSNLQHYALWLQARYQLLASSAAAEQATAMSANFGLSPPYDYNAPAISVSPFQTSQYQTSFYNSSASSPPHSASPWSQPSMSPTSFAQEASGLQDIHTDYQPVSKESLFPMSSAPSFPHWSNSTSSSDSGSLLYPEYRFSGSDESARGVQARLAYAYQSAADATQQGQAESVTACLGQQYTGASQQGDYAVGSRWN